VIVLTSRFSGVPALTEMLSSQPGLTCTSGTGVVPMCAQAIGTWQQVENSAAMSALAASSVRALASSMITCILAAAGGSRWCETVVAPANTATAFARLFPQAQFLCFHRACEQVIAATTQISRWGLASTGMADFAGAYPGNNVAAVAAYWRSATAALLDFEAAHPGRAWRVRHEDVTAAPAETTRAILDFLGLPGHQPGQPGQPVAAAADTSQAHSPGTDQAVPLMLIPQPMLALINDLHAQLGYPRLRPAPDALPNPG
jgi:hypothetical protein